jgi:hypothetical protein
MAQRVRQSPVLGYNHNLRHGGRVFHVQTEDSGQGYARLHTHLFYEGTILSTKKQEYDPSAPEDAVRALMQQLHKSMIRELTHGEHDTRIGNFFIARGEPAMLDGDGKAKVAAPAAAEPAQPESPPADAAVPTPIGRPGGPAPATAPITAAPTTPAPAAKPVVMVKPGGVRRPPVVLSSSADGVVVRRNVVINVGGGRAARQRHAGKRAAVDGHHLQPRAPGGAGRGQRRRRRSVQGRRGAARGGGTRIRASTAGVIARDSHALGDARSAGGAQPATRHRQSSGRGRRPAAELEGREDAVGSPGRRAGSGQGHVRGRARRGQGPG